jgi:hypothetical protein
LIVQTGDKNEAFVEQSANQHDSAVETATQTASVTQTGTTRNLVHLSQNVDEYTNVGSVQVQDVHQSVVVLQTVTGTGNNSAQVNQSHDEKAFDGATQSQNTRPPSADCDTDVLSPTQPNACANIEQHADAGDNDLHLRQSMGQDANSSDVATQQQGLPAGGLDGRVHQETVTGTSMNDANQNQAQQVLAAPGSTQTQFDPVFCCDLSQIGGTGNTEKIDQSSSQKSSSPLAFQELSIVGESVSPTGTCSVTQHGRVDVDTANNSVSLSPCPFVELVTACVSASEEAAGGCTAFPPITTPPELTRLH